MTRTFLCPPTFYDVTYSINPFMDPSVKVDRVLAWRQWSRFVDALEGRGLDLQFIEPRAEVRPAALLGPDRLHQLLLLQTQLLLSLLMRCGS